MTTALQQAKERLESQRQRIPQPVSLEAIQYCWYAPTDLTHRDQGKIKRLRWTPIVRREQWVSIAEKEKPSDFVAVRNIKADLRLPDHRGKPPNQGMNWLKPGAIANSLYLEFGEWGILISPTLAKIGSHDDLTVFEQLRLDDLFFPMPEERLPATYQECKQRVVDVLRAIESGKLETVCGVATARHFKSLPPLLAQMVITVGREMLDSLERSKVYQDMQIGITHSEFEKAKTEGGHRGTYDKRDRQIMAWLEIVPQDEVLNRNAQANTTLIELAKQQLINGNPQTIDSEALGRGIASGLLAAGWTPPAPVKADPPKPEARK